LPTVCPALPSVCATLPILCPQFVTRCPEILTQCPSGVTGCPQRHTICPSLDAEAGGFALPFGLGSQNLRAWRLPCPSFCLLPVLQLAPL
jgi:hypothetical protein